MKRLLLTGATGFIGRHCLTLLSTERVFEIHAVSSKEQIMDIAAVHWHKADLLQPAEVRKLLARVQPSHLLHLAWYAEPGKYLHSLENLHWVQASLELLEAFSQHGGQRAIVAGTCAEYDWKYGYLSEYRTPLVPVTLYGKCKHALQMMLAGFAEQTGLSTAWGRVFFLYGPHEHPDRLVSSVIRSLLQGNPARCSPGNQIRDYLAVQDVAGAFIALLDSDVQGPVNIASGRPVAVKDVVLNIAGKLGKNDLVQLGAIPAGEDEPPLLVGDVKRLSEEVGWVPRYTLEQGLETTIAWWKNITRSNWLSE